MNLPNNVQNIKEKYENLKINGVCLCACMNLLVEEESIEENSSVHRVVIVVFNMSAH